jgi:2,4-didehydro-3-deoxy-L-rhamnonate hydrolase
MKLIRFGNTGEEKPGIETTDGKWLDITNFGEDFDERFFGEDGINKLKQWLTTNQSNCPELNKNIRLGCPIVRPSKLICVGLNYALHAAESGMAAPDQPVLFMKATSSISGPFDDIVIPKGSIKTDWEVELAVVIGKKASYIDESHALDHVAGYMLHNDVSERDFQLNHGGQWVKGKSCDTFAPLGPYLVSSDEIDDPQKLNLWLKLNGKIVQNSNTNDMIFPVSKLVSYISQYMTLLPGDIISTGTPAGVGMGLKPPKYLQPGDIVELGIDGLGISKQSAKAYSSI